MKSPIRRHWLQEQIDIKLAGETVSREYRGIRVTLTRLGPMSKAWPREPKRVASSLACDSQSRHWYLMANGKVFVKSL